MTNNIYSVGQVNNYIKNMFANDFMMKRIFVKGEVSNCKYHSSGHVYFALKDETGVIKAVMFANSVPRGLKFRLENGQNVIVFGAIRTYERDGSYQLYASQIVLEGAGELYRRFEELKKSLMEMGMFDQSYKQSVPKYASKIGIVTALTGAAIRDIQNISYRRNPYVELILYPAQVQGEGAAESIVKGIEYFQGTDVDVIIVGRGGGSIEDLWAFNEEIVARAIFNSEIPIISAVGHETDTTIADFVADLRAPTPSAAAELAVFDYMQVKGDLDSYRLAFNRSMMDRLDKLRDKVTRYELQIRMSSPENKVFEMRQKAAAYEEKIQDTFEQLLTGYRHKLEMYASRLDGYSPLKRLSGGYTYVSKDEHALTSTSQISKGDVISGYLTDGKFEASIVDIQYKSFGH